MRVFVLNTGRCGSKTLTAAAQKHVTNYTAGHETRAGLLGDARLEYPDRHIEADNRLAWFLGPMEQRHPEAYYVHLLRDPDAVARSHARRWPSPSPWGRFKLAFGASPSRRIMPAFAHGIAEHGKLPAERRVEVARFLVDTVTANIRSFLADRPHIELWIDDVDPSVVDTLWDEAEMDGDRAAFLNALGDRVYSQGELA